MEDEERQRKLEAGKAKLAEYRQRKAQSDGQKKQKKKKKKKQGSEEEYVREEELDPPTQQEMTGERKEAPTTELLFTKTLHGGEAMRLDHQTSTHELESEVSTTAEDSYSSEVNGCHEMCEMSRELGDDELCDPVSPLGPKLLPETPSRLQVTQNESMAGEELHQEVEEIRDILGAEGVQQLQDFEAALKQRDGIITQLTTNLQQARVEKDEVMREFLELTEQSQKLQLQFQQLQAGQSLRSSSISNAAADLLQTRQQLTLYQQQVQEQNAQVRGHQAQLDQREAQLRQLQEQVEEKDTQIGGLQKKVSEMEELQKKLSQVTREAEESFAWRLQEKDQQITEEERSISQLRDNLHASEQRFHDISEQLAVKICELQACEQELHASKQKERLSSTEIMQLMATVEDMQKRHHQGSQSEGEVLQRAELDATRRLDLLRAELDELYGQQIVQMKQELLARHAEEMARVLGQHSRNAENVSEHHGLEMERLRAQWSQSAGEVNALSARLVEVQQRLQETQVLREKAEHDLAQASAEKLRLQEQVQDRRRAELRQTEAGQSQTEADQLQGVVCDLQARLAAAEQAWSESEAKRESEITNYQIKLEMLQREKDAVLDRMAESQEAELERLHTQLLFSHEEELSQLRQDLQHENQMNMQNLRAEHDRRHHENVQQLRSTYEEKLRVAEEQSARLTTERVLLLQDIVTLKNELRQLEEGAQVEQFVQQLNQQTEAETLRLRACDRDQGSWSRNDATTNTEQSWDRNIKSENKLLKETNTAMADEVKFLKEDRENLLMKIEALATENKQIHELVEQLRAEIKRQKDTFSIKEKNFEVKYQELKEEYIYLTGKKTALEARLQEQALQYTAKLHSLQTQLQPLHQGTESDLFSQHTKEGYEEKDGGALVEKDTVELMEKLQRVEEEKLELVVKVEQKEAELQRMALEKVGLKEQMQRKEAELLKVELERVWLVEQKEAELQRVESEKVELEEQMEKKEAELQRVVLERVHLVEQKEAELKRVELEKVALGQCVAEVTDKAKQREVQLQALVAGGTHMASSAEGMKRARSWLEEIPTLPGVGRDAAVCGGHHLQITALEQDLHALHTALQGAEQQPIANLQEEGLMPLNLLLPDQEGAGVEPMEGLLAPPLSQAASGEVTVEEGREREPALCEEKLAHTQHSTAADADTHDRKELLHGTHKRVNSRDVHRSGETESGQPVTCLASMDGSEHEECRLQMEGQRISLCQIHTAQLELLQESLHTHMQARTHTQTHTHTQTQEALEWLQVQTADDPKYRYSKYRTLMEEVTEDCGHLIQSFSRVLGVEVSESLQRREDPVELSDLTLQKLETSNIRELLVEARELYSRLQQLNQCVVSSHQRLLELQTLLMTSADKLLSDQTRQGKEDFQRFSTTRPTLTRRKAEIGSHTEQAEEQRAGLWAELREEFQKQQELREEQHKQEVESLRTYYSEHTWEVEQRYTAEIHLLQDRLQQLTQEHALCSMPRGSLHSLEKTEQLQAPFLHLPQQDLCEDDSGGGAPSDAEEHDRCRGAPSDAEEKLLWQQQNHEEEIAKVIVLMAVEFAQQTEQVRISRLARENSTGTQTVAGAALPVEGDVEQLLEELRWREEELLLLKQKVEVLEPRTASPKPRVGQEQLNAGCLVHSQKLWKRGDEDEERVMKKREEHGGASQDTEFSVDVTAERNLLRKANERLRQVLVDVLKTTAAAEETIGRHVEGILEAASRGQQPVHRDVSTESYHGSEAMSDDASVLSGDMETDEGLEMSHVMGVELELQREELQLEKEEYLMNISTRLQIAVEKLLVAITKTTNQLEHAKVTQTELMRENFRHGEEMAELLRRQDELQERLQQEAATRQQLAQQLHQAEGLIDGYSGERRALEEQVRERTQLHLQLEQELQVTSSRLRELEQEQQNLYNQQELLSRQQDAMRDVAGARELHLLEETEKLMKEKVDVERQAEKEHAELLQQVKQLEAELEEQVGRAAELEEVHRVETTDLTQQIHALEKQLDNNRRFLDEQAMDREHERDVFQQEIQKLEQQLKNLPKPQSSKEQLQREVEELRSALNEKTDCCSELLLRCEQLQRDVEERNEEMEKLEARVRDLEQALLLSNTAGLHKEDETPQFATPTDRPDVSLETLLQTEREALDRKEKEIGNLEEQLEQFREELQNKSEEVQQLNMQLEIQKKEINTQQQELVAQSNLQAVLEEKDREVVLLNEQITKLRDTSPDNKEVVELGEVVRELEAQVEYLRGEQKRLKHDSEEQVEQLNSVIEKLQEELSHMEHKRSTEEDEEQDNQHCHDGEYDELKQKMDETTKELNTLKADHSSLLCKYERLQEEVIEKEKKREVEREEERAIERKREEERKNRAEEEKERVMVDLEEALRDRTAMLVVTQAQVQALEESATSRMTDLNQRVEELEQCMEEKELELKKCRLQVEKAQVDAESLHLNVAQLEEKLREKVAAMLVSQAQLEAVQVQTKELHSEAKLDKASCGLVSSDVDLEVEKREPGLTPLGKVGLVTEKLTELQEGLSAMQKDQELQKQLLTSSEEDVQEYEKRLALLTELLNQMRTRPVEHTGGRPEQVAQDNSKQIEKLLQELQEVKGQAAVAKEELNCCKESSQKLQEELQIKDAVIEGLQTDLQTASNNDGDIDCSEISELLQELQKVKGEAAATKEELNSLRGHSQRLQEQLKEQEMTIALLKDQHNRVSSEADGSELLQEVKGEVAASAEELNTYIKQSAKLQEELQVRDGSIAELKEELQQLRAASVQASDGARGHLQPPSHSKKRASRDHHSKSKGMSVTKDKPTLSRKNSTRQAETGSSTSSANGSEGVSWVDVGTQVELAEELEEVISEYTERIGQMQELHAAEIMDMENRHISESESLKRDNQRLEQECSVLRASINSLRVSEAARLEHPTASQFRDGYTSDSSSDWSQRTGFELPHLQAGFRSTPEGAHREDSDPLPERVKTLLREVHQEGMQVLSLSELSVPEVGPSGAQLPLQAWRKEREALIDTVAALKGLITQLQMHETQMHTQTAPDWRTDLLRAVQQIFMSERDVLKTALLSHMDLLDTSDDVIHLNHLQRLLTEQDSRHREALSSLHTAEQNSLLAEISQLRAELQHCQDSELTPWQHPVASTDMCETWSTAGGGEWERVADRLGRAGDTDVSVSYSGRSPDLDIKTELAQTKLELETTLKTQQKYLKELDTLRCEVSVKARDLDSLGDQLLEEQKRVRELQWAAERETSRAERRQEGEREEVEDLRLALEEQRDQVAELSASLEEERQVLAQLKEQREKLQVKLEAQQAQTAELNSALHREKLLNTQLLNQLKYVDPSTDTQCPLQAISKQGVELAEASCSQVEEGVRTVESLLQSLQGQLTEKHSALVELMEQLEQQKLQAVQAKCAWEQERAGLSRNATHDRSSLQEARESLARLQRRVEEVQAQLDGERERRMTLDGERDRLQLRMSKLTERLREVEQNPQSSSFTQQQEVGQRETDGQLSDRTRDWVLQQKAGDAVNLAPATMSSLHTEGLATDHAPDMPTYTKNLDSVIVRLQLIANKINSMTNDPVHRLPMEDPNRESLIWIQSNMQDVMSLLQQVPSEPPAVIESTPLLAGGSSSTLTERLLRQNAELTGFVSRLTEEKNEMRNQLLRLEEELRRQRHLAAHSFGRSGSEELQLDRISSEREMWSRERSRLEKSLRQAESELSHLRGEIRSSTARDLNVSETDNAMLKRIYGKYLRAESFRKALIYQKKYLLLLLGGFQECEEATLSLIARMGGRPTHACMQSPRPDRHGLTRFRSAVRVSIAISRMRFLVRRWQKAAGGSTSSPIINRNGLSQTPGGDGRNESPYMQPAGVEVYGERRGTNRGRTGRDSPRSGHSTLQRYGGMVTDGGGLLCPHLQNYDPDRALTDYISRLEALQRRLGSVQSGSSSYAQLHFGIRR